MRNIEDISKEFITDIYVSSYLNKKYQILNDKSGFIKNSEEIVLFSPEHINYFANCFPIIKLYDLSEEEMISSSSSNNRSSIKKKVRQIFLLFNSDYFLYIGSRFKKIRKALRKYQPMITSIVDYPVDNRDFDLFVKVWKQNRKKAHHIMTTGVDRHFVNNLLPVFKQRLISKFFYIQDKLVGFSIFEKVSNELFNNIFCKIDTTYPNLNLFIDSYMFEILKRESEGEFIVNMGSDNGNRKLLRYKECTFPAKVQILERYEVNLKQDNQSSKEVNHVIG